MDRLSQVTKQIGGSDRGVFSPWNCVGACRCSAAFGSRPSLLGPLLAPAEVAGGPSIHEVVHKMRDDQNTNATFSGANPPGLVIDSGDIFEVTTLDASGGHITRNGEPQLGAIATPGRVHRNGGPSSVIGPEDDPGFGTGNRAGYQVPGVTSGNPICERQQTERLTLSTCPR